MSLLPPEGVVDYVKEAESKFSLQIPNIKSARENADRMKKVLAEQLSAKRCIPDDTSFIVYGSLARREWTANSDLDWSLLIDGAVDPAHVHIGHTIRDVIANVQGIRAPGRDGIFGNLSFSHDLVHHIGGQDDTNRNLTQRILLLLESCAIGDEQAYDRVVRSVLERYCEEDTHLYSSQLQQFKIPRFLVNDVVRFWRTMAVDYVSKRIQRKNDGWALRNAKLRVSRKLIFVSGLLICFNVRQLGVPGEKDGHFGEDFQVEPLISFLSQYAELTPLDILCQSLLLNGSQETAQTVLTAYDEFLGILNDYGKRKELSDLKYDHAEKSELFGTVRNIGSRFQTGLESLFFSDNTMLGKLTRTYGIF